VFYYYGRKKKLAKLYPEPEYPVIVEPFAGSAAYSIEMLMAGKADRAILVEKDPQVVEVWNRLLGMSDEEVAALEVPVKGDKVYDFLWKATNFGNAIFVCEYIVMSEIMAKGAQSQKKFIQKALPLVRGRIEVIEGDYRADSPDIEATWFIDPPYQNLTGSSRGRGDGYGRDCQALNLDFAELGEWCKSRRGQVMVCESLGADWLPFKTLKENHTTSRGIQTTEVVWYNHEQ
jgi:16S rRNA G966 N2-methylase RsmD